MQIILKKYFANVKNKGKVISTLGYPLILTTPLSR